MTAISVADIEAKVSDARARLATLDQDAQSFALPAVAGNEEAATTIARINGEIRQITADVAVLELARLEAAQQQREADEAKAAADRARHMTAARDHALDLLAATARLDAAIAELADTLPAIGEAEAGIRQSLGRARFDFSDGVFGRLGLGVVAVDKLMQVLDGRAKLRGLGRSISDTASGAWDFLLNGEVAR